MIVVREDQCDFCGVCVAVCPQDAIELLEARIIIHQDKCNECMKCVYICPLETLEKAA